jgi:MFS family permease
MTEDNGTVVASGATYATDPTPPRLPGSPFQIAIFRRIWLATVLANLGTLVQGVGAAWLMVSLTNSPDKVALVQTSMTLPMMLLALWSGAVADNFDRRRVMIAAQIFLCLISVLLFLFAWYELLTPWVLLTFTFLIGCGVTVNAPAQQAAVGDMVPRDRLTAAVAVNSMSFNIARSIGPAIGGAVVAVLGAGAAFLVNAVALLPLLAVLVLWRIPKSSQLLPRERLGLAMAAGARYAAMSPNIRLVVLRAAMFGVPLSGVSALMPVVAKDTLGGGSLTYGLLLGAYGLGSVGSGLLISRLRSRLTSEQLVQVALVSTAIGTAGFALSGFLWLSMIALLFVGVGWVLALSTFNVAIQLSTPRWVVGRALAIYQMAAFGGMAIGAWLFGAGAQAFGISQILLVAAAAQLGGAAFGYFRPIGEVGELNLDPPDWNEPAVMLPIEPRSGPVVVSLTYKIAEPDTLAFLALMAERRRVRRRDGARGWTLLRDLAMPNVWVERYHVATWLDYRRYNSRRTIADLANWKAIEALHQDEEPPRIRRMLERQTGSLPSNRGSSPQDIISIVP